MELKSVAADATFEENDIVAISGRVKYRAEPEEGYIHVFVEGELGAMGIKRAAIVGVIQQAFETGDAVIPEGDAELAGVVRAINDVAAWVEFYGAAERPPEKRFGTFALSSLERYHPAKELPVERPPSAEDVF